MSSTVRRSSGAAGFSLAEVLVALAIAAMMTAMLTRFAAGTRLGAVKVAERAEMAVLGETLLARVTSAQRLRPGRTDGRAGGFAWRIDIAPVPFETRALRVNDAPVAGLSTGGPLKASRALMSWTAYRVAVLIRAPSGQSHAIDTVRLGPGGSDDR